MERQARRAENVGAHLAGFGVVASDRNSTVGTVASRDLGAWITRRIGQIADFNDLAVGHALNALSFVLSKRRQRD
jgi:hypothetical protein